LKLEIGSWKLVQSGSWHLKEVEVEASGQSSEMAGPEPGTRGTSAVGSRYQATWRIISKLILRQKK
jgi:hypothetical protein